MTIPEMKLVLFGSPKDLAELVRAHPRLTIELPLKLLICEGDDGQSLLSYHAPDSLARGYELTEDESDTLRVVDGIARHTWSNRLV